MRYFLNMLIKWRTVWMLQNIFKYADFDPNLCTNRPTDMFSGIVQHLHENAISLDSTLQVLEVCHARYHGCESQPLVATRNHAWPVETSQLRVAISTHQTWLRVATTPAKSQSPVTSRNQNVTDRDRSYESQPRLRVATTLVSTGLFYVIGPWLFVLLFWASTVGPPIDWTSFWSATVCTYVTVCSSAC